MIACYSMNSLFPGSESIALKRLQCSTSIYSSESIFRKISVFVGAKVQQFSDCGFPVMMRVRISSLKTPDLSRAFPLPGMPSSRNHRSSSDTSDRLVRFFSLSVSSTPLRQTDLLADGPSYPETHEQLHLGLDRETEGSDQGNVPCGNQGLSFSKFS